MYERSYRPEVSISYQLNRQKVSDFLNFHRTLLKSEVESAVNGKQWLLSCFGPFKESTTIPNLMDRSFEEVRLDFLEASKNGTQQMHINELGAQYSDSLNKLNQLKMASPETIRLVANIYNQSVQEQKKPAGNQPTSSVFGASAVNKPQSNPFQMGNSVFGGSPMNQTGMNTGSIFGSSQPASNPFQSSQSSIFGASQEKPASTASNFSFALGQQPQQQSLFGSSQPSTQQSSIFGSSTMGQQPQQTNSIFGSSMTSPQPASSIFGAQTSPFGQSVAQPSIFGASAAPTNIFGSSAAPTSTFGSNAAPASSFGQVAAPSTFGQNTAAGVFGSTPASSFGMASSNVFGSSAAPSSTFGSMANPSTPFGDGSMFALSTATKTQPANMDAIGCFGPSVLPRQQPAGAGIFGSPQQLTPQNSFGQPSGNVFGGFQSQMEPVPQQQTSNIFAPATAPSQNVFGAPQNVSAPAPAATGSIFQIQQQAPQTFGGNPFLSNQPAPISDSVYSKVEDLTPEELQAFQADTFELGKIPSKPPPKHLCV